MDHPGTLYRCKDVAQELGVTTHRVAVNSAVLVERGVLTRATRANVTVFGVVPDAMIHHPDTAQEIPA